jgi:hypothetical protein
MNCQEALAALVRAEIKEPGKSRWVAYRPHDKPARQIRIAHFSKRSTVSIFEQRLGGHHHAECGDWHKWDDTTIQLALEDLEATDWEILEMDKVEDETDDEMPDDLKKAIAGMLASILADKHNKPTKH